MTAGQYLLASGIVYTEQDTVAALDAFMVGALGWDRLEVIAQSAGDWDVVWHSPGEVPGARNPIYARARGNVDYVDFFGYTYWNQLTSVGDNENHNATESRIYSQGTFKYWFVGNKDAVYVYLSRESDGAAYLGGFGYWESYYDYSLDPYPLWVMGQYATLDTFTNTARVSSYVYNKTGYLREGATYSGAVGSYLAGDYAGLAYCGSPNPRDQRYVLLKAPFYRPLSYSAITHEVRGELPGAYTIDASYFSNGERLVASGTALGDAITGDTLGVGNFVVCKSGSGTTFKAQALGPVTDYNPFPPTVAGLELWYRGDAVERYEGGARRLIDLSGLKRDALQLTGGYQPFPLVSGVGSMGQPYIRFDDYQYLIGSAAMPISNNYTAFVVAKYAVADERQPALYIRGDVGGKDYIFGMEFNVVESNSAEFTVQTDTLENDVLRFSGLTTDTFYIMSAKVSVGSSLLYINGDADATVVVSGTKTTIPWTNYRTFGVGTALDANSSAVGQDRLEGGVAEVLVYTRTLTSAEHQSIVCYLGGKYGITVSGTC